ncbi:hypothetical protein [Marinomonas ostreistagni]|uniref:hypothetical protein n=1 Tax=Marinomonas ostreistagni TaxID=359209 RepID=UPI001951ADF6|nr:hypothetical protein [Marinomonas ostreistagni]MBM6550935.1 hypothetical protein [Marinomonas ostreistagni]
MSETPTSRAQQWLVGALLLECLLAAWALNTLWQWRAERIADAQQAQFATLQQQRQQQAINALSQDPSLTLLGSAPRWQGLRLQHQQSLADWQTQLEGLQQQLWIVPQTIRWQRQGKQWHGDLEWAFVPASTLKPNYDVLPLSQTSSWTEQGVLVSTVQGRHAAALVKVQQQEVWLRQGQWSPLLQATLSEVQQDRILLNDQHGQTHQLPFVKPSTSTVLGEKP